MRILSLALAAWLAGCASPSGTTAFSKHLADTIDPHSTVAVEVLPGSDPQAPDIIRQLRRDLFGALVSDGLFREALQPGEPADYVLTVTLQEVRIVGNLGRTMGAAFAGPDRIKAHVELLRDTHAAPIMSADIVADSAVTMTGRNDIQAASDEAVDLILDALKHQTP